MPEIITNPICILGAGPAGVAAALTLAKQNIACTLIDKSGFPKNKICGDGLSGHVLNNLRKIDPSLLDQIVSSPDALESWGIRFYSPNLKSARLQFKQGSQETAPGFTIKRQAFDAILHDAVKQQEQINFFSATEIKHIYQTDNSVVLTNREGTMEFHAQLLLYAGGTNQSLLRKLDLGFVQETKPGVGIRAYYKGVSGINPGNLIEIHFLKELLPWYFWIFPLRDNEANVGLAMLHDKLVKRKVNLSRLLTDITQNYPHLKNRFQQARLAGPIEAHRLPYYYKNGKISGHRFLALGDSANLIEPFTGEGIGNALSSGIAAAEHAAQCLEADNFSSTFNKQYDDLIYQKMSSELKQGLQLLKRANRAPLINLVIGKAERSPKFRTLLTDLIFNLNNDKSLTNPLFYLKILLMK